MNCKICKDTGYFSKEWKLICDCSEGRRIKENELQKLRAERKAERKKQTVKMPRELKPTVKMPHGLKPGDWVEVVDRYMGKGIFIFTGEYKGGLWTLEVTKQFGRWEPGHLFFAGVNEFKPMPIDIKKSDYDAIIDIMLQARDFEAVRYYDELRRGGKV